MAVHKGVGHYGAPITLDQAKKVMAAAEAKALQNDGGRYRERRRGTEVLQCAEC